MDFFSFFSLPLFSHILLSSLIFYYDLPPYHSISLYNANWIEGLVGLKKLWSHQKRRRKKETQVTREEKNKDKKISKKEGQTSNNNSGSHTKYFKIFFLV